MRAVQPGLEIVVLRRALQNTDAPPDLGVCATVFRPPLASALRETLQRCIGHHRPASIELAPPSAPSMSLRVLVAEDNLTNRTFMRLMLVRAGHDVHLAKNGAEAIDAVRREQFDLVFMDIQMPEIDGLEATRRIRSLELQAGGHVPIVALTAHAMREDREQCLQAGMDDYLSKPVAASELEALLERIARQAPRSGFGLADGPAAP